MKLDKIFEWNPEKSAKLLSERGLSFEMIVAAIDADNMIDFYPSLQRPHQKMLLVEIDGYVVVVPSIEKGNTVFFKTAYHSRKALKIYLEERK